MCAQRITITSISMLNVLLSVVAVLAAVFLNWLSPPTRESAPRIERATSALLLLYVAAFAAWTGFDGIRSARAAEASHARDVEREKRRGVVAIELAGFESTIRKLDAQLAASQHQVENLHRRVEEELIAGRHDGARDLINGVYDVFFSTYLTTWAHVFPTVLGQAVPDLWASEVTGPFHHHKRELARSGMDKQTAELVIRNACDRLFPLIESAARMVRDGLLAAMSQIMQEEYSPEVPR